MDGNYQAGLEELRQELSNYHRRERRRRFALIVWLACVIFIAFLYLTAAVAR